MEKNDLLRVLDQEIDAINNQKTKPGWTSWAILTAIAGLAWVLINLLEASTTTVNIQKVLEYSLMGFIIYDCLRMISSHLFNKGEDSSAPRFLSIINLKNSKILSHFLEYIIITFLLFYINLPINHFLYDALKIEYILTIFVSIAFSVCIYTNYPLQKSNKGINTNYIFSAVIFLYFAIFINYFFNFKPILLDMKIAAILLAIGLLLSEYISSFSHQDLILEMLQDIRRKLNFGYINSDDATTKVDILIFGRKGSDLLEGTISDTMNYLQQIENIYYALEKISPSDIAAGTNPDIHNKIVFYFNKSDKIINNLGKTLKKLENKSRTLTRNFPETLDDINTEVDKITKYSEKVKTKSDSFFRKFKLEKINKEYVIGRTEKDFINFINKKTNNEFDSKWIFGDLDGLKDSDLEKNNHFELKYWTFAKNKNPKHKEKFQKEATEYTFIIKGEINGTVEEDPINLKTGDYIIIKPGITSNLVKEVVENTIGITIKSPSKQGDTQGR